MQSRELLEPDRESQVGAGEAWLQNSLIVAGALAWSWEAVTGRVEAAGGWERFRQEAPSTLEDIDELVHADDRLCRRSAISRALSGGEPWVCSFRLALGTEPRWMEERGRAWLGPDGQPQRAVALAIDVTARRRAEESLDEELRRERRGRHAAETASDLAEAALRALSRSEAFLESIFASMEDGLVLYGPDGRISRVNPRARQMLGLGGSDPAEASQDLFGRLHFLDVEGEEVPRDELPVAAALRGDASRSTPLVLQFPDGRNVWVAAGAAPIRAPGGDVMGAVLTLADVTRLRELQEHREDLARMISHDLRAPLGVILAQAKLLARRSESAASLRARSEAIVSSAQRMAAMLTDLVESALLEAGKLRLELVPLDLVRMLADLRGRLAAPYNGDRIRVEFSGCPPVVLADPNRMERVLVNLLTNALKYSAAGSEVVARVRADGPDLVIEVEDQGQGIAPEDLPHLFQRYFRALGSSRLEGMGLGLYTARMLVEAHGGSIAVASVPGKGSVFRVRLPLPAAGSVRGS